MHATAWIPCILSGTHRHLLHAQLMLRASTTSLPAQLYFAEGFLPNQQHCTALAFTLKRFGMVQVTNDTLLNVVYNMLTNTSLGGPGNHWFSPMNTVISSVVQNEQPRRLARRYAFFMSQYSQHIPVSSAPGIVKTKMKKCMMNFKLRSSSSCLWFS